MKFDWRLFGIKICTSLVIAMQFGLWMNDVNAGLFAFATSMMYMRNDE